MVQYILFHKDFILVAIGYIISLFGYFCYLVMWTWLLCLL